MYMYNALPFGLQQVRDIIVPTKSTWLFLPSQQLYLEDHATSEDSFVRASPLRRFSAFQVLIGGQQSTEVLESC
jgi:hypothetical protein